jgi:apolipoprotein N-acyltransferase
VRCTVNENDNDKEKSLPPTQHRKNPAQNPSGSRECRMFSAWMIGFLLVMATLVWVAVIVGLPQPAIGLAIGVLLAVAVIAAAVLIRRQRPPHRRRG